MDFRNVNFSIKKSQIHTHILSLSQKLTKLDIAWKDKCCMGFWMELASFDGSKNKTIWNSNWDRLGQSKKPANFVKNA